MARHAEVKEKEIIEAGQAIQQRGKVPNPGAIRAQLGFRGGLARIRRVWEGHLEKHGSLHKEEVNIGIGDLPSELADACQYLLSNQQTTLEALMVQAYSRCQSMFEKRLDEHISQHAESLQYYANCEISADESIQMLEDESRSLNKELNRLAEQNAKLIVENAELKGQLKAFEQSLDLLEQQK